MIRLTRPTCPRPAALTAGNYKHEDNKDALRVGAHDKCMYCESKITHVDHADVEHIKPKGVGKFPQLEFVWDNLGYSCRKCNNAKGVKFDIGTPYIDPYAESPDAHLCTRGVFYSPYQGSERGELTITDIQLNRSELIERRGDRLIEIENAVKACFRTQNITLRQLALDALKMDMESTKEYSFFVKAFLSEHGVT